MQVEVPEWCGPGGSRLKAAIAMDVNDRSDPARLRVQGEIDIFTVPVLEDTLSAMVSGDCGDVVVDLADVHFVGVAGLDALCRCARELHGRGHRLVLSSPSALTRRVIDILGLVGDLTVATGPGGGAGAAPTVSRR